MPPDFRNPQSKVIEAGPKKVSLFKCHASLAGEPSSIITRAEAAALVASDLADWRSGNRAVQLRRARAECPHRDQSCIMSHVTTERAAQGSDQALRCTATWLPNQKGGTYREGPNARKAA